MSDTRAGSTDSTAEVYTLFFYFSEKSLSYDGVLLWYLFLVRVSVSAGKGFWWTRPDIILRLFFFSGEGRALVRELIGNCRV